MLIRLAAFELPDLVSLTVTFDKALLDAYIDVSLCPPWKPLDWGYRSRLDNSIGGFEDSSDLGVNVLRRLSIVFLKWILRSDRRLWLAFSWASKASYCSMANLDGTAILCMVLRFLVKYFVLVQEVP